MPGSVLAPAKTPKEMVSQLAQWFTAAMQVPERGETVAQALSVAACGADFARFFAQVTLRRAFREPTSRAARPAAPCGEDAVKFSSQNFSAACDGPPRCLCCAVRFRAGLSVAARPHRRWLSAWQRRRRRRAADEPVAGGAIGSAVRRREPAGRRLEHRDRGGRARGARRLHAAVGRPAGRDQRHALRQAQLQFPA